MIDIIVLAAGKGTRMKSRIPKALNKVAGRCIIHHLLDSISSSGICTQPIIVVSSANGEEMKRSLQKYNCKFLTQPKLLGTGHAVACVLKSRIHLGKDVMVIVGDNALFSTKSMRDLCNSHEENNSVLTIATSKLPANKAFRKALYRYGRIKRDKDGEIIGIVEKLDATVQELEIQEIHPSLYIFETRWLKQNIEKIKKNKIKAEYYLTDIVSIATWQGVKIRSININNWECLGVNTQEHLKLTEAFFLKKNNRFLKGRYVEV